MHKSAAYLVRMHKSATERPGAPTTGESSWNVDLLTEDMKARGWLKFDLARRARVSHMTVGRFLNGQRQTARTAKKLARALGHEAERYLIRASSNEAVA